MHFIDDFAERRHYAEWVKKFSDRIREVTGNENVVMAELEIWDFNVTGPFFNLRKSDPVDAANVSLSHYSDHPEQEKSTCKTWHTGYVCSPRHR